MTKGIFFGLILIVAVSCHADSDVVRQEIGMVWRSGGLYYCAEQLHLENGDTLIVDLEDIIEFVGGDSVSVRYREIGRNKFCSPAIDCEIIEIIKLE